MNSRRARLQAQNPRLLILLILLLSVWPIASGIPAKRKQPAPFPSPIKTLLGPVYPPTGLPADEDPRYFPDGTFNGKPGAYDFTERFCAWYFRSMKEPSLLDEAKRSNVKVYRFLKIPPYFHPWSVRITILRDGTGQAVVKTTNGTGIAPGYLTRVETVEVSTQIVERFVRLLDQSGFWSMPTIPPLPPVQPGKRRALVAVMGGTPWTLEGAEPGKYHAVERVQPSQGPFATLCAFMLEEMGKVDSMPHRIQPPNVPADIAAVVPSGYKARVMAGTALTRLGETLLVYEKDEVLDPDAHVVFLRSGRVLKDVTGLATGCYSAGFKELRLDRSHRTAALAFRCAADGSISRFVLIAAKGASYEVIFRQQAPLGALDVWGDPRRLHIFFARTDLDRGESCVYCLHRYTIKDFAWKHDHFKQVAEQTPQYFHDPNRLVEHPFFDMDYP